MKKHHKEHELIHKEHKEHHEPKHKKSNHKKSSMTALKAKIAKGM